MLEYAKYFSIYVIRAVTDSCPGSTKVSVCRVFEFYCGSIVDKSKSIINDVKEGINLRTSLIAHNWNRPLNAIYIDDLERIQRWGPILAPYLVVLGGIALDNLVDSAQHLLHTNHIDNRPPDNGSFNFMQQVEPSATPASPDANSCYYLPDGYSLWQFAYEQSEADPTGWGNWQAVLDANQHLDIELITPQDCVYHPAQLPEGTMTATPLPQASEVAASCLPHQVPVAEGDTLYGIAADREWNWQQTQNANQVLIDQGVLYEGDCVNPPGTITTSTPEPIPSAMPVESTHTPTPNVAGELISCNTPRE